MGLIAGLFALANVVSRGMGLCLGAFLLSLSIQLGVLARCEEEILSLSTTDCLLLGSG